MPPHTPQRVTESNEARGNPTAHIELRRNLVTEIIHSTFLLCGSQDPHGDEEVLFDCPKINFVVSDVCGGRGGTTSQSVDQLGRRVAFSRLETPARARSLTGQKIGKKNSVA
jgi:hypothetical protein